VCLRVDTDQLSFCSEVNTVLSSFTEDLDELMTLIMNFKEAVSHFDFLFEWVVSCHEHCVKVILYNMVFMIDSSRITGSAWNVLRLVRNFSLRRRWKPRA